MPAKRPERANPLLGVTDEIADIMGTRNPRGVRDSYPIKEIEVAAIQPNPEQPRKEFDEESLRGLSISIKNHGIVEPLVVTFRDGVVYCVAGERRLRAARLAGLATVPCIVREELSNDDFADLAVEENMHRANLTPLEEAYALDSYMKRHNVGAERMADIRGLSRKTVENRLALIRYPEIAKAVADGRLRASQAATITFTLDRPGQGALRRNILATLARGESLTADQMAAATGVRVATSAGAPPAAPAPVEAAPVERPLAPPNASSVPPPSMGERPRPAGPTAADMTPIPVGSAADLRSPAVPPAPVSAPAAADRPPGAQERPSSTIPSRAEQDRRFQDLQALNAWLAAPSLAAWIAALPPEILEGYLAQLQHLQQHLPAAIAVAQARRAQEGI